MDRSALNEDFRDLIGALVDLEAEFLVVGDALIKNKRATGRDKDLVDVRVLEAAKD